MQNSKMTRSQAGKLGNLKRSENIRKKYEESPNLCKHCKNVIPWEKRHSNVFCSQTCAAFYNNSQRDKNIILNKCLNCDIEIIDLKNKNRKYCCNKCQQDYQYKEKLKLWKDNKVKIDSEMTTVIRKYLFEKYDSKCAKCGWNEKNIKTGLCPLEVDHIDGNHKNNLEENLILLCPNCHSLTPTYKNLNKGNGRKNRMKRYREGKTF